MKPHGARPAKQLRDKQVMSGQRELERPLRHDVRFLGRLLGEVLIEQEGAPLFFLEEQVRKLAIARRRGPREQRGEAASNLAKLLADLPRNKVEPIIRAFSVYFRLINLAEQHDRIRRGRVHAMNPSSPPRPGSFQAVLQLAKDAGHSAERVRESLRDLEVTITLTAHPTEAARRTILEKLYRIAELLEHRDRSQLTPSEIESTTQAIREEIAILWLTDEVRRERPTVGDEVKNACFYIEEILWGLLPQIPAEIAAAFDAVYHEPLEVSRIPVRIHSWVGGDMDGNPYVTPTVVADAIRAYRARGLRQVLAGVRELGGALSHSSRRVKVPQGLLQSLEKDAAMMPDIAGQSGPRTEGEPWRRKLRFMEARLEAALAMTEAQRSALLRGSKGEERKRESYAYKGPAELERDLALIVSTLEATRAGHAGEGRARSLLETVRALGLQLAELELRAPARDAREGEQSITSGTAPGEGGARVLSALAKVAEAQAEGEESCCRTLVLSMTQGAEDVLAALSCARHAGLWDVDKEAATIDIVPLFESFDALTESTVIVRSLLDHPTYRKHVQSRGGQEIMVGYSDSGKEVGLLAASAALRRAQRGLVELAKSSHIPIRIFHGRGESVARGGGPSQQAILALPRGSVAGRYKATEQGEALDHKYGRPEVALRTLELMLGGALLHTLDAQQKPLAEEEATFSELFDELAEVGRRTYRALVWEEPLFEQFFLAATPLEEIANFPIGSRPSKRSSGGLDALRAIPWVFAWTQNRAIVPGWYGVGSALASKGSDPKALDAMKRMYVHWPFFRAVLDNVEMVLAKTDLAIAARYAELAPQAPRKAVWPLIQKEHARTREWLKKITLTERLLERNPSLKRSIELRNPYVDPLSFLQVELVGKKRRGEEGCDRPLLLTLNGIAAGMRNTG